MNQRLSILAIIIGALAILGEVCGLNLPSVAWFFNMGRVFGWVSSSLLIAGGIAGLVWLPRGIAWNPVTLLRFRRFRSLKRGWWSLIILIFLSALALLDHTLVGRRALIVRYEGKTYFPALVKQRYEAKQFGMPGDGEVNYRELRKTLAAKGSDFVFMPPVPWDAVLDTDSLQTVTLEDRNGIIYEPGSDVPFSGRARSFYQDAPEVKYSDLRLRKGKPDGEWLGYTRTGALAVSASYKAGVKEREKWTGEMPQEEFQKSPATAMQMTLYPPIPPLWQARHFLGTDSKGWDVAAHIYGGWQVNLKAVLLFVLITYGIGVLIGCLMGYLGGFFDLAFQRIIEIIEQLPFLYVVMIVVSIVTVADMNLAILLGIICLFSWTSLTYTMRSLAYKEKERDYVAAARLQGASNWRIITRYLLPNMLSTLVTQIPFSVAGIIYSLTALSFVGFGLPETYASWGWLFEDGTNHLKALWIPISMFVAMVFVLLLVTFVGEALREAFDPKKFTTYQ